MFNNNVVAAILQILDEFYRKGFPSSKCNEIMDGNGYKKELEDALDLLMKKRNGTNDNETSIVGYIFQLLAPILIIAFNYSFRDPFMFKKNEDEVTNLREAFVNESYEVYLRVLRDVMKKPSSLTEMRERLISISFRRFSTESYVGTVKSELPDYPCNVTPGERHLYDVERRFEEEFGRTGTDEELAEYEGCRPSTIRRNRELRDSKLVVSLQLEVGDDPSKELTLGDIIPSSYRDFQPDSVVEDMLNDEIDDDMRKNLSEREYRRTRTRIDNDDMSEMNMAIEEVGIEGDSKTVRADKRVRAVQRSINRDLVSSKIKLRVVMEKYRDDIL